MQQLAQIENPVIGTLGNNVSDAQSGVLFTGYLVTIWQAVITTGALAVLIYFIWGSVEWITAGGEQSKIQSARDRITQAIIGLILLVGSFIIIGFIGELFFGSNFNLLELTFPDATGGGSGGGAGPGPAVPGGPI